MADSGPCIAGTRRAAVLGGGFALLAAVVLLSVSPTSVGPASAADICKPAPAYLATAAGETIGGIGGTGHSDPGTGGIGGTGIVGTITGFASVCVNGVEVHYDNKVPVSENGRPSSVDALAVGQVVALDAGPGKQGLTARRIEVMHALEGPVTRNEAARLEVMGASVVPADVKLRGSVESLKAGQWVQVNGHRDESGRWVATRVVRIESRNEATILAGAEAGDRVGGVRVEGIPASGTGEVRMVRGEWKSEGGDTGGRLRVRESVAAPAGTMLSRTERMIVETRVREVKDGRVRTGHPEIDAALSGRDVRAGELVRIRAVREANGQVRAERIERSARRDAAERSDGKQRDEASRSDRDGEGGRRESTDRGVSEKSERIDKIETPEKIENPKRSRNPRRPKSSRNPKSLTRSKRSSALKKRTAVSGPIASTVSNRAPTDESVTEIAEKIKNRIETTRSGVIQ